MTKTISFSEGKIQEEIRYVNGYLDGSGKGTILKVINGKESPILRTHWGCSCCDDGASDENILLADKITEILNNTEQATLSQRQKVLEEVYNRLVLDGDQAVRKYIIKELRKIKWK